MSIGDLLTKSHPHNDDLFKVGLGGPEALVEESFEVLAHVAIITEEMSLLLQRVRYIATQEKVLHVVDSNPAISLELLSDTNVALLHSLVH